MRKVITFIRRIYRLSLNKSKQESLVFKDLEKLHIKEEWRHGVYKNEKYIETTFGIADDKVEHFYYMIDDGYFHCFVKVLDDFPIELTTEFFILATHFNNLLKNGTVRINANNHCVEYVLKSDLLVPLLYEETILYAQMIRHYETTKDIYWAFQRLINENEAPAIIIADLLKKNEEEEQKNKTT